MESRLLRGLLLCVLVARLFAPSLSEIASLRKSLEKFGLNIVDGEEAKDGRYRYTCLILIGKFPICTGFLVHPKIVITAAHCYFPSYSYSAACGGMLPDGSDAKGIYPGKFVTNPSYIDLPGYHDIAMVVLKGAYNLPLPIVSRDLNEFKHGRMATAIGWGEIKENTGLDPQKLKIARDIIPTDLLCEYDLPTLCAMSASGRVAHGDSGGPLVIEGDSAEEDIVFGITSAGQSNDGLHVTYFTNLPYYLDSFISPHLRGIEKETVDAHFPKNCLKNPKIESVGSITAIANECTVLFTANNTAKIDKASVKWDEVVRGGSKVAFDIVIDGFAAEDLSDLGFVLVVYEDISLYVHGDGEQIAWINDGEVLAYSVIKPGSGIHKVRIENTETGYEIYEDGLKSAVVDIPFPRKTVVARFDTIVQNAGLSYTMKITSIRMATPPAIQKEEEETTLATGPEVEDVPAHLQVHLRSKLNQLKV